MERDPNTQRRSARPGPDGERDGSLRRSRRIDASTSGSSLIIGAKTLAGVGIGLVAVVAGALAIGVVAEAILVPSLLLKLAGGIAGGGMGMAKGLKDAQKMA